MSTLGTIFVQPQKLRRAAGPDDGLGQDFLTLASRLLAAARPGSPLLAALESAFATAVGGLQDRVAAGLDAARPKLLALIGPLRDLLASLNPQQVNGAAAGLELGQRLLLRLAGLADGLTLDAVRRQTAAVLDVLEHDLGLSSAAIEEQVWALVADLADRLERLPAANAREAEDHLLMAAALRRLAARARREIAWPALNAEAIARRVLALLRSFDVAAVAREAACVAAGVGAGVEAFSALNDLIPLNASGARSVGAAAAAAASPREQFAWYATWLLEHRDQFFLLRWLPSSDKVRVSADRTQITVGDTVALTGTDLDWTQHPLFNPAQSPHYTFRRNNQDFLENWTRYSSLASDGIEGLLHWLFYRRCHALTTVFNTLGLAGDATLNLAAGKPLSGTRLPLGAWYSLFYRLVADFAFSFQGIGDTASGAFAYWSVALFGIDAGRTFFYWRWTRLLHSTVLAAFTLVDQEERAAGQPAPENVQEEDSLIALCVELATIVAAHVPDRKNYSSPLRSSASRLPLFLGGLISAVAGEAVGLLLSQLFLGGRGKPDRALLGRNAVTALLQSFLTITVYYFLAQEGDTDGGRFNPAGAAFPGYPGPASGSPYKLPFAEGQCHQCSQANQGIGSHNTETKQVYAYDFALPVQEVLAARPGTLVDFFDWVPDDTQAFVNLPAGVTAALGQTDHQNWNFVTIRHDGPPVAPYDRDENGPTTTYATYGHGRKDSVRQLFATKLGIPFASITPADIVGQTVAQGQPIMLAGHTGQSDFNHLHIEVRPDWVKLPGSGVLNGGRETLPFVFSDVPGDGVCKTTRYYESKNPRTP